VAARTQDSQANERHKGASNGGLRVPGYPIGNLMPWILLVDERHGTHNRSVALHSLPQLQVDNLAVSPSKLNSDSTLKRAQV